jgi:hypothetical protein
MQKLIAAVADKGLSVLAHVDHAGAAAVRHGVENGKVVAAMREMLAVLAAKATQ